MPSVSPPVQTAPSPSTSIDSAPEPKRILSVDALRGFDMFWILGADSLVHAFQKMSGGNPQSFTGQLAHQLEHADWEGFRF
jgi:hypothetical protein